MDYGNLFFDHATSGSNMLFMGNTNPSFPGPRTMINIEENPSRKRLFFSSQEELIYDDEYYDDQLPEKKRRLTPEQVHLLEKSFEEENKLEPERKTQLAKSLGLQPRQVAVWFQNRRARSKTKQLERDYDVLKASYDSLLSNYEAVLKENEKLKSQVNSLTEKLEASQEDVNGPGPITDPLQQQPADGAQTSAQQQLSSGSSSGVVNNNNEENLHVVGDSGWVPHIGIGAVPTVPLEEDDISDDGRSYFPGMFIVAADRRQEEEEEGHDLGWWVWS